MIFVVVVVVNAVIVVVVNVVVVVVDGDVCAGDYCMDRVYQEYSNCNII